MMTLFEVAQGAGRAADRASSCADATGAGRCSAAREKFQTDPHWRDLLLFYEYFHGDNGAGIGASHQTGWTGCVARIIQSNALLTKELLLAPGAEAAAFKALQRAARQSCRRREPTRSRR